LASSSDVPSANVLVGEGCHIVAEEKNGPRGASSLSLEDRNRYPNLILLCRNHHAVIDGDVDAWPIERLHQLKADHELWVETQLVDKSEFTGDVVYSDLINSAVDNLLLDSWEGFTDHAVRSLLLVEFVEGTTRFGTKVFRAVWPGTRKELEAELKNLADRVDAYVKHFMSRARLRNDTVWVEDTTWKQTWVKDYDSKIEDSAKWFSQSFDRLRNVTVALNGLAVAVRASLNPNFFLLQGKFVIHDSMGTTNGMIPVDYLPEIYST
jgi:hypothetical protein